MNYIESYHLFESKGEDPFIIPTDDIEDIFSHFTDVFNLSIEKLYLSKGGRLNSEIISQEYYPVYKISLKKIDKDNSDIRWDGSIYYHGDVSVINELSDSLWRINSTYSDKISDIQYNMSGNGDIIIRILLPMQKIDGIDYESLQDIISRFTVISNPDDYDLSLNTYNLMKYNNSRYRYSLLVTDSNSVISGGISNGQSDNKSEIWDIFKQWCNSIYKRILHHLNDDFKLVPTKEGFKITKDGDELITFKCIEDLHYVYNFDANRFSDKKKKLLDIFSGSKKIKYSLYDAHFEIELKPV